VSLFWHPNGMLQAPKKSRESTEKV
jgi:hypothetical protein